MASIYFCLQWCICNTMTLFNGLVYPGSASRTIQGPLRAQGPFPRWKRYLHRRNANSTTTLFSGQHSIRYVQTPMLASPPVYIYHAGTASYRQPERLHHAINCQLPSRTVIFLYDRIVQLSWLYSHTLDCNLIGCSLQR